MHLADATLAEVEGLADFLHCHLFEVVQDNDQEFGAAESASDQILDVLLLCALERIVAAIVAENVDFANVLVSLSFVPLVTSRDQP